MRKVVIEKFSRVVYGCQSAKMMPQDVINTSKNMAELGGVKLESFTGNINWIRDRVKWLEQNLPELFTGE
jgi:hypothetical protein